MKEKTKKALENLFDNDPTNSNNIFDRIQHQMTGKSIADKIDQAIERANGEVEENEDN